MFHLYSCTFLYFDMHIAVMNHDWSNSRNFVENIIITHIHAYMVILSYRIYRVMSDSFPIVNCLRYYYTCKKRFFALHPTQCYTKRSNPHQFPQFLFVFSRWNVVWIHTEKFWSATESFLRKYCMGYHMGGKTGQGQIQRYSSQS